MGRENGKFIGNSGVDFANSPEESGKRTEKHPQKRICRTESQAAFLGKLFCSFEARPVLGEVD